MDFLLSVYNQVVEILRESPLYIRESPLYIKDI